MYLEARIHLSKYADEKLRPKEALIRTVLPEMFKSGNMDYVDVMFEAGYWRKANAIHKWFVDHCAEGKDDCRPAYVEREQLVELRNLCEEVLKNKKKAKDLLPPEEGFFFGTPETDDWYFEALTDTIEIIDKCLKLPNHWDFVYKSSW